MFFRGFRFGIFRFMLQRLEFTLSEFCHHLHYYITPGKRILLAHHIWCIYIYDIAGKKE